MALYTLSDLHLSLSADKPMDVFGTRWQNHLEKLSENWNSTIGEDDLVIVGGDISWAMYLEDAKEDFAFLNSLNGKKLLSRGNHDYWWSSKSKLNTFLKDNGFGTINFLQNDAFLWEDTVISGTRGWICPGCENFSSSDEPIYERELIRLSLSLDDAEKIKKENPHIKRMVTVLHYPPFSQNDIPDEKIVEILSSHGTDICLYGHLHGPSCENSFTGDAAGIKFILSSCDHLSFTPYKLDD